MRRIVIPAVAAAVVLIVLFAFLQVGLRHNTVVVLRVATTTSLYDTGLLDRLAEAFEASHPHVRIEYIPVGSGQALRLAADRSVCLVLVHAPNLEKLYIERGVLKQHVIFAYNFFVIVGPRDDPAHVANATSAVDAFRRIYAAGSEGRALFISRGDCSGTYVRERVIWMKAGLDPRPGRDPWYISTGTGMAATLRVADEKRGYTLSDIGTFAALYSRGALHNLVILYPARGEEPLLLMNVYSAYLVNGCSGEALRAAREFLAFLAGEGQRLIASYRVGGFQLFYPASGLNLTGYWSALASLPTPPECR